MCGVFAPEIIPVRRLSGDFTKMRLTLQSKLDRFRPVLCRLLARRLQARPRLLIALTDEELAERASLPISEIKRLSWSLTWQGVPVDAMLAFMLACGVDLDDRRSLERNWKLLRSGCGSYLRASPQWQTLFVPLVRHSEQLIKR